jgi:hypothetical protein
MTVTFEDPVPAGPYTWLLRWSSDQSDPSYRVFRNGVYQYTTGRNKLIVTAREAEATDIDVLDSATEQPAPSMGSDALLGWNAVSGAEAYRIERYVDSAWTLIAEVDSDKTRFHYRTPPLSHSLSAHQFRVTSIGTNKNESSPLAVNVMIIRRPDPPDVGYTFSDSTKKVTVAAA